MNLLVHPPKATAVVCLLLDLHVLLGDAMHLDQVIRSLVQEPALHDHLRGWGTMWGCGYGVREDGLYVA